VYVIKRKEIVIQERAKAGLAPAHTRNNGLNSNATKHLTTLPEPENRLEARYDLLLKSPRQAAVPELKHGRRPAGFSPRDDEDNHGIEAFPLIFLDLLTSPKPPVRPLFVWHRG
jgi:hypothetical protein